MEAPTDTHGRALAINLDPSIYGTFAEIGAGQEVANWFLRVGAASGTVAQTVSAYDKTFSDERYGQGTRYVSRERLIAMLDYEFQALLGQLDATRSSKTRFFAFANTVAARSFSGENEQHGWVGLRFEARPRQPLNDILLHVALRDASANEQREALGVLGVNLLYAAYFGPMSPDSLLGILFDGLSLGRLELDVIGFAGPLFHGADARRWCLSALRRGMCPVVSFDSAGQPTEPSSVLRKRALIVEREHLGPPGAFEGQMFQAATIRLQDELGRLERAPIAILESSLVDENGVSRLEDNIVLKGLDRLAGRGTVLVSSLPQAYLLVEYLRRYTSEPIRLVTDAAAVARLLAGHYTALPGSLLEALGKLLANNVKIYCYPLSLAEFQARTDPAVTARVAIPSGIEEIGIDDLRCAPPLDRLLAYLREAGWIAPLVLSSAAKTGEEMS